MRTINILVFTVLLFAATPTFAQREQPANARQGVAETEADKSKPDKESEAAKNEARKARREHRRMVNHRQRHKH